MRITIINLFAFLITLLGCLCFTKFADNSCGLSDVRFWIYVILMMVLLIAPALEFWTKEFKKLIR
tara:strand:+ start:651 stop:845 length:195 start_codon:yes stop_codon:yes gene_type:complete